MANDTRFKVELQADTRANIHRCVGDTRAKAEEAGEKVPTMNEIVDGLLRQALAARGYAFQRQTRNGK